MKTSRAVTRKRCIGCYGNFKPPRADARYCSGACRQAAKRARDKLTDYGRAIEAARLWYWRLVCEAALARGVDVSQVVTDQSFYVDLDGNVYQGFPGAGRLVGHTPPDPKREGWAVWGLEAAGPPWSPPPPDGVDSPMKRAAKQRKQKTKGATNG